mmetsp:Transcript_46424/g.105343  ORF Transcript_46424/g.105343 Transcript_46424/m.105343 type:complete len:313 (-) Transcript_46424:135-1073(-)
MADQRAPDEVHPDVPLLQAALGPRGVRLDFHAYEVASEAVGGRLGVLVAILLDGVLGQYFFDHLQNADVLILVVPDHTRLAPQQPGTCRSDLVAVTPWHHGGLLVFGRVSASGQLLCHHLQPGEGIKIGHVQDGPMSRHLGHRHYSHHTHCGLPHCNCVGPNVKSHPPRVQLQGDGIFSGRHDAVPLRTQDIASGDTAGALDKEAGKCHMISLFEWVANGLELGAPHSCTSHDLHTSLLPKNTRSGSLSDKNAAFPRVKLQIEYSGTDSLHLVAFKANQLRGAVLPSSSGPHGLQHHHISHPDPVAGLHTAA